MIEPMINEWIAKAKAGDGESLEKIVKQYFPQARGLARKSFLVGGDNEDLLQEGLLAIINAVKTYDESKNNNFGAYVTMCIRSRIIDTIRAATREKHQLLNRAISLSDEEARVQAERKEERSYDPISAYLEREWKSSFRESLEKILSPSQLKLLELYFEGFSYQEIADKLKITTKKVDNTLSTIKSKIRREKSFLNAGGMK